jgi:hypothetical protein
MSQKEVQMSKQPYCFINNRKLSKFQPTGSRNCGVSLPPYVVEYLDSIRGGPAALPGFLF